MPNCVVLGSQWGDEGKAKVIDYMTPKSDVIVRFQGGANAGHTVINDKGKFIFHMVPSGIMSENKICIIGNGVVFDPEQFIKEVKELESEGIDITGRLFVSDSAHLVLPCHKISDQLNEEKTENKIGTTGRGIGPAYADKISRKGLRTGDMIIEDSFLEKLKKNLEDANEYYLKLFNKRELIDIDKTIEEFREYRKYLLPLLKDTSHFINQRMDLGDSILFEGAQGSMLDIDHGTYPYVTSSNTTVGAVCSGSGIGPSCINHVIGIVKAYTTRVGNGPFPTMAQGPEAEKLQNNGAEFGATTGRPRRCGWFDSVLLRKSIELNGFTRLAVTKLDVLDDFESIYICKGYEIEGKEVTEFPNSSDLLDKVKPVYEKHPG
ncbi:MAG: adenylosuccinate synthase, partial [Chitinivibrionales bacterium]